MITTIIASYTATRAHIHRARRTTIERTPVIHCPICGTALKPPAPHECGISRRAA